MVALRLVWASVAQGIGDEAFNTTTIHRLVATRPRGLPDFFLTMGLAVGLAQGCTLRLPHFRVERVLSHTVQDGFLKL